MIISFMYSVIIDVHIPSEILNNTSRREKKSLCAEFHITHAHDPAENKKKDLCPIRLVKTSVSAARGQNSNCLFWDKHS